MRTSCERVPQDEPLHLGPAGAERHPDADLSRALRRDVGDDAVKADCRQRQRQEAEHRRHLRHQPLGDDRRVDLLAQRTHRHDGEPAVDRRRARDGAWPPRLRDRWPCALRAREDSGRAGRAARTTSDGLPRAACGISRPRPAPTISIMPPRGRAARNARAQPDAPADRIGAAEELADERLVDDRHARRRRTIRRPRTRGRAGRASASPRSSRAKRRWRSVRRRDTGRRHERPRRRWRCARCRG